MPDTNQNKKKNEDFTKRYYKFCYNLASDFVEKYLLDSFKDLQVDLKKAFIRLSLIEYLSVALVTAGIVFFFQTVLLSIIFGLVLKNVVVGVILGFLGGIISAVGIFMFFYIYPPMIMGERAKRIDDAVPFATLYLATMAGTGTPIVGMFKMLSKFKHYGEISEEAKRIVDAVELTGAPVTRVLEDAAERTPSEEFRELLWGIKSTISVGGDLKSYLHEKAEGFMQEYRRRLMTYTNQMLTFLEIYINAVILGSVFFIVMTTVLGVLGTSPQSIVMIHLVLVFLFLPAASLAFIVLLKGVQPATE